MVFTGKNPLPNSIDSKASHPVILMLEPVPTTRLRFASGGVGEWLKPAVLKTAEP